MLPLKFFVLFGQAVSQMKFFLFFNQSEPRSFMVLWFQTRLFHISQSEKGDRSTHTLLQGELKIRYIYISIINKNLAFFFQGPCVNF